MKLIIVLAIFIALFIASAKALDRIKQWRLRRAIDKFFVDRIDSIS